MKIFFLTLAVVLVTSQAFANPNIEVSVKLPIRSQIINLATMPVEEALAFCNERNMACPAIRNKYEMQRRGQIGESIKTDKATETVMAQTESDQLRIESFHGARFFVDMRE